MIDCLHCDDTKQVTHEIHDDSESVSELCDIVHRVIRQNILYIVLGNQTGDGIERRYSLETTFSEF